MHDILKLLFLIQCKHLIIDWVWQPEYEWKNKGIYGHFGGIQHALKNAFGTMLCFAIVFPSDRFPFEYRVDILLLDFVIHYHIDWCKMNLNRYLNYGPLTTCKFWWLLGLDQYLHQITYLMLIYLFV